MAASSQEPLRDRQHGCSAPSCDPTLAVVVPVRNEAGSIGACLDALLGGTTTPDEILVVDGCSTDGTREIVLARAAEEARIRLLHNPARTVPSALNIGWRATTCDLVVRIDGHALVDADYLGLAREHLRSGVWQGVGGRKNSVATTVTGRVIAVAMGSRWGVGNSRYHYATSEEESEHVPFGAYPRHVIEKLGGWDEDLLVNQDFEFDYRLRAAGGRILFDPAMSTSWACSTSLRDLAHQYHRYGKGKAAVARKHPRSLRARHLLPPGLVTGLACASVLALSHRHKAGRLGRLGLASYLMVNATSALVGTARTLPANERARFPLVIAAMHLAWGSGFLRGLLSDAVGRTAADPYRRRSLDLATHAPGGR